MVTSSYEWKIFEWDDKTQTNRHFFTSNDVCKLSLLKFLRYLWGNANRLVNVVVICRCMRYPSVWIISYLLDTLEMKCIRNRDMPHAFALYFLIIFLTFETFARFVKWRVGRISLHFWRTFGQSIFFFRHCCEFQDFTKPNYLVLYYITGKSPGVGTFTIFFFKMKQCNKEQKWRKVYMIATLSPKKFLIRARIFPINVFPLVLVLFKTTDWTKQNNLMPGCSIELILYVSIVLFDCLSLKSTTV